MSMTFENIVTANGVTTSEGDIMGNTTFNKEAEVIEAGTFHSAKGDTMRDIIYIHKEAGAKKDAVRVRSAADIPDFLKEAIKIVDGKVQLECVEGTETADFGEVIGYETSENTASGYNCWVVGNADTNLVEKNGVFYKKATIMKAMLISEEGYPSFLSGADIRRNDDGSWTIKTSWGESSGIPGKAYWVLYGIDENGKPDANILTVTEKSFRDYIVCDEDGEDLLWLYQLDAVWNSGVEQEYIISPKGKRTLVTQKGARIDG